MWFPTPVFTPLAEGVRGVGGDTPASPGRGLRPLHPHTPLQGFKGSAKADPWPEAKKGRFQSV